MIAQSLQLCTKSILLLVTIAALDNADKSLLSASFPVLERTLHLDVEALGYFSLFSNISYALALPFWGWLVHRFSINNAHNLLAGSCLLWGLATLGIAFSGSAMLGQAFFRFLNGAALASILPLSQSMMAELVPPSMLGRAFGLVGVAEKASAMIAVMAAVWCEKDWRIPYFLIGGISIVMAVCARNQLRITNRTDTLSKPQAVSMWQTSRRIAQNPSFLCLVGQGVFGAVPWDMMSFILLLLDWKGFTKEQIVTLQFMAGIGGTIGGAVGGILGDWFVQHHRLGRIGVAVTSVVGGALFYSLFLYSGTFGWSVVWFGLFHTWGSWTNAAANRPLCAEMSHDPSERAQVVAAWLLMEKTSAAVFGAPLVGYITKNMLRSVGDTLTPLQKADVLASSLMGLSLFFWGMCGLFWVLMAFFLGRSPTTNSYVGVKSDV